MEDFPYPRRNHAEWFWESGFNVHPIEGLLLEALGPAFKCFVTGLTL